MEIKKEKNSSLRHVLLQSWDVCVKNTQTLFLTMAYDVLFFIALGFVTRPLFDRIIAYAQAVFAVLGKKAPELVQAAAKGESTVMLPGTSAYLWKLVLVYLVLFVVVYLVYSFIEGLAWRNTAKLFSSQQAFSQYLLPFFRLSLVWVFLFGIYHLFTLYLDYRVLVAAQGNPYPALLTALRYFCVLFFGYFIIVTYAALPWRKTIGSAVGFAWQHFSDFAFTYIFIWVVFILLQFVLIAAFRLSNTVGIIAGMILVLPWLSFVRVLLMQKCVLVEG